MQHRSLSARLIGCALLAAAVYGFPAKAFTVSINPGNPRAIYLQVGVGSFTGGNYNSGGQPAANNTINVVSVSVATAAVGNSTAQAMNTNTGATNSFYDGYAFCNANQLYVGGFYRFNNNSGGAAATLTANSATELINSSGQEIPFTQIRWVSSGNDGNAGLFPSGTFSGTASQSIGSIARNQWSETCMTFSYLNTAVPAAGTYTGRVTYTLTAP